MDFAKLMKAQLAIMEGLFTAAQAENRDYSEEEQEKYNAAEKEFKRLKAAKEQADALASMGSDIPEPAVEPVHEPAPNASASSANIQAGDAQSVNRPYANLGDMLQDVAKAKSNIGESRDRLVKASLNTETGADGEFLVPPDFVGSMLKEADSQSELFSRATQLTVKGNTADIPAVDETSRADGSRFGGIQVYWLREGGEGTYKQPKFRNLNLKLAKIMGLVSITDEMLEDSALLSSWVQTAFPAEMAFHLDQALFDGDGNGIPLGVMNSGALVTVAKEGSQTADTVVYENIVKMWARMPSRRASKAVWYITQQVMEQLPFLSVSVGDAGGPVYVPPGGASGAPYATLMGRPIVAIEQAATLGDLGDILLADMSDYITIVKGGLKTAQSIHVAFDTAKTSFRFIRRVNGAPYTRSSLASRASSSFLTSPYITLAARA